jgi:hypothetical protein
MHWQEVGITHMHTKQQFINTTVAFTFLKIMDWESLAVQKSNRVYTIKNGPHDSEANTASNMALNLPRNKKQKFEKSASAVLLTPRQ